MADKFCSKCGHKLKKDDNFCPSCGTSAAPGAAKAGAQRKSALRDILIIGGFLALTVVVFLLVTKQPEMPQPETTQMITPPGHEGGIPAAVLDKAPTDYPSLVSLGNEYMDSGNYPVAAEMYRRALEIDGNSPDVRTDFGACLHGMGLANRALDEFRTVLRTHPEHAIASFNMGVVFQGLNEMDSAKYYWQKYLDVEPNGQAANAARQYLKQAGG